MLQSFAAPPAAIIGAREALNDRVAGATSGLLGLVGIDADPLTSREHILIGTLLGRAWREGYGLDLPTLSQRIQKTGLDRIGVMGLESVFPAADRLGLAMRINNLLASLGFEAWAEGAPLDVADDAKPLVQHAVRAGKSEIALLLINKGAPLDAITRAVQPPRELADRPYLQPIYDEPEFIVRNIWRYYGGWYNDRPSDLKPASTASLANEVAQLAGSVDHLIKRAMEHLAASETRLACHLIDWAAEAEPDSREVHAARAAIYKQRNNTETSTMAKGIFRAASVESQAKSESD